MITVHLSDGTIKIGGEFSEALEFIKSKAGRKYDPLSKSWSIPSSIQEFRQGCRFPLEIPGGHVTRYGNHYSDTEWKELQDMRTHNAQVAEKYSSLINDLDGEFSRRLLDANVPQVGVNLILANKDLYGLEESGKIAFSSPERRMEIFSIYEWYLSETEKLFDAQIDEEW